jgi:Zn-dependent oligopeptidase
MSVRLVMDTREIRAALAKLPEELRGEAGHIVEASANEAVVAIRSAYPVFTGNLRDHVYATQFEAGRFVSKWRVINAAKHAWIFEHGTVQRHTGKGANRGIMPPGNVFIPTAIRVRRRLLERLRDMLVQHGLMVRAA